MRLAVSHPELFDRAQWFAAAPARREQIARAVAGNVFRAVTLGEHRPEA